MTFGDSFAAHFVVSIHAPVKDATSRSSNRRAGWWRFDPRAREGATPETCSDGGSMAFRSTRPRRRDRTSCRLASPLRCFDPGAQEGATNIKHYPCRVCKISIHAPAKARHVLSALGNVMT